MLNELPRPLINIKLYLDNIVATEEFEGTPLETNNDFVSYGTSTSVCGDYYTLIRGKNSYYPYGKYEVIIRERTEQEIDEARRRQNEEEEARRRQYDEEEY